MIMECNDPFHSIQPNTPLTIFSFRLSLSCLALELIEHLRAMGETNALVNRIKLLKRDTALATAAVYESMFAAEDGTIPATFQVIYMTGWREHESQQKAKRRGSATVSFNDIQKQFGGAQT